MWFYDTAGKTEYVYARIKESSRYALEVFYILLLKFSLFHFVFMFIIMRSLKNQYNIANVSFCFLKVLV